MATSDCKKIKHAKTYYQYVWGENYDSKKWFDTPQKNDELILWEIAIPLQKKSLGTYIYKEVYAISGDWSVVASYYYGQEDHLYAIDWRLNTFYADEPATVEKKLYFDQEGNKIKEEQAVFALNSNKPKNISFMDRPVEFQMDWKDEGFYPLWKANNNR